MDAALIERMSAVMSHRGSDDHGAYASGGTGLGHRRLSIIDLTAGQAAIVEETRKYLGRIQ
jgi:asparagine synthase (glutamine-hydrolysing)